MPVAHQDYQLLDTGSLVGMSQGPLVICNGRVSGLPDIVLRVPRLTDLPVVVGCRL